jgi:ATP-dependent DNA helicase RecG
MMSILPIGIGELLTGAVESSRLELKASWDEKTTGPQVLKTLCAFANDLQNLNGGYVVIGVAEENGVATRPVRGLDDASLDAARTWLRGHCNQIEPAYVPVFDTPEIDGHRVLVLWAPASETRPHQAPIGPRERREYWVRVGADTVRADGDLRTSLIHQTARVPFDDRRCHEATVEDLRLALVREFLADVRSDLVQEHNAERIYDAMRIVAPTNGHKVPRNIGLLFFSDDPARWFRGARIEVAEYAEGADGNVLAETVFSGPLHHQLRQCLMWLENFTTRHLEKRPDAIETRGWVSYPALALREAIVNALYHRGYDGEVEPTKVHLYPDRVEIISYPGPVQGIELTQLQGEHPVPPVPARNRRIGELLKELHLAEARLTGIPKIRREMRNNGSAPPRFDFDTGRSYFRVTLPAHPEYVMRALLRDYSYLNATGNSGKARELLEAAWEQGRESDSLAATLIQAYAEARDLASARRIWAHAAKRDLATYTRALTTFANVLADAEETNEAGRVLDSLPSLMAAKDAIEAAITEKRLGRFERAHRLFQGAEAEIFHDPRAAHEYAQTKMRLANLLHQQQTPRRDRDTNRRLLGEAGSLLERVTQMDAPPLRHAWAWRDLARTREWLRRPRSEVLDAYDHAIQMAPDERRFQADRDRFAQRF